MKTATLSDDGAPPERRPLTPADLDVPSAEVRFAAMYAVLWPEYQRWVEAGRPMRGGQA